MKRTLSYGMKWMQGHDLQWRICSSGFLSQTRSISQLRHSARLCRYHQQIFKRTLPSCSPIFAKSFLHTSAINYRSSEEILTLKNERVQKYINHFVEEQKHGVKFFTEGTPHAVLSSYLQKQVVDLIEAYWNAENEIQELVQMKEEYESQLADACDVEIADLRERLQELEVQILSLLLPSERGDESDIIMEISAGVGGQEAMLFTADLFKMYEAFAAMNNWEFEPLGNDSTGMGGLRKASAAISGVDVYRYLKYEGGVHRVQRVPKTEKSGRIHTSTSTVAILPQPTEIEISLRKDDLKWDTFRASGSGGQHVNKTESAVRVTHIPSGMVAECQINRSQIKNRELALTILRSKLYEKELLVQQKSIKSQRKLQVGSGGRSEKIRTYNFQQDRITDHRLSLNMHNIDSFLAGEMLEELAECLIQESFVERLEEMLDEFELNLKKKKRS